MGQGKRVTESALRIQHKLIDTRCPSCGVSKPGGTFAMRVGGGLALLIPMFTLFFALNGTVLDGAGHSFTTANGTSTAKWRGELPIRSSDIPLVLSPDRGDAAPAEPLYMCTNVMVSICLWAQEPDSTPRLNLSFDSWPSAFCN